jgi:hypothetical protein
MLMYGSLPVLEWTVSAPEGDRATVRLRGAITEAASFEQLALSAAQVVLVADGIRYINSTGLQRLWGLIEPLARRCSIEVERCSPALVAQLNMMPALAACVRVTSIIAPLECSQCVAEADTLLPVGDGPPTVPPRRCEVCGGDMVLAELEERYFAFLA